MLLPKLSESLAGRMEVQTLWPFSQGEMRSVKENLVDALFSRSTVQWADRMPLLSWEETLEMIET
jgi:predicted AAA+ superfamily ATPase